MAPVATARTDGANNVGRAAVGEAGQAAEAASQCADCCKSSSYSSCRLSPPPQALVYMIFGLTGLLQAGVGLPAKLVFALKKACSFHAGEAADAVKLHMLSAIDPTLPTTCFEDAFDAFFGAPVVAAVELDSVSLFAFVLVGVLQLDSVPLLARLDRAECADQLLHWYQLLVGIRLFLTHTWDVMPPGQLGPLLAMHCFAADIAYSSANGLDPVLSILDSAIKKCARTTPNVGASASAGASGRSSAAASPPRATGRAARRS